jgi:hypothetical protein
VVTTGFVRLTDGAKVVIGNADGTVPTAKPRGNRSQGSGNRTRPNQ